MTEQIRCPNCGAMMTPKSDGRTVNCPYCEAELQVAIDSGQIAAGLQIDLANVDAFLFRLAATLHANFAALTKVQHDGGQLQHFEIKLDPDLFVAKRESYGDGMIVQHKKLVRGVALKTVTHPIDQWVELLTQSLAKHANTRAAAAHAIAQFSIKTF
jgi:hypothetical protein